MYVVVRLEVWRVFSRACVYRDLVMLAPRGMDAASHHHHHLHLEGHDYHAPPISRTIQYKKVKRSIILSSWWKNILRKNAVSCLTG